MPGKYFLIKCDSPASAHGLPLPASDMDWVSANFGVSNGIVALLNNQTTIATSTCPSTNILDLVGYGTAICFETTVAPALSNSTAAIRTSNNDTDNNYKCELRVKNNNKKAINQ